MIKLRKGNAVMAARNKNQAAAFLNNGWELVEIPQTKEAETASLPDSNTHYTKTEINRLSTAELKDLAEKENLSDVDSKNGGELKKELIEHFNL